MEFTISGLTIELNINDSEAKRLREDILSSIADIKTLQNVLNQQSENRKQTNCYSCNDKGGCAALRGVAHLYLWEIKTAIKEFENANVHFSNENESWNNIIGLALLAIAYEMDSKRHQAILDYQRALDLIDNYIYGHENDYKFLEDARPFQQKLRYWLTHPYPYIPSKRAPKKNSPRPFRNKTKMTIPWMPAYFGLQAGPNGPIWADSLSEDGNTFVDEIILEDKLYEIYSTKPDDHLVTLTSDKNYGWAKVSGDSMNASKPIPIFEEDFVLFYEVADADNNAIVIAACADYAGAGYQYVVKRYSKNDQLLISESEPPILYDPVPINKDTKIIGVVIAVAKSEETEEDYSNQFKEDVRDPENKDNHYNELVLLVRGDINVAQRLINYEKILSPQSGREECIERAIARLLKDRRA